MPYPELPMGYRANMVFALTGQFPKAPAADCPNCILKDGYEGEGHCYMFVNAPTNGKCGQMTERRT